MLRSLVAIMALAFLCAPPASAQMVAIKAGKVITMTGAPISPAVILVKNGRITAVRRTLSIPASAKVIDASGMVVMPGIIAPLTRLAGAASAESAVTPDLRALDSFDLFGDYERLLEGGITSIYVAAPPNRLVAGQGAVIKLAPKSQQAKILRSTTDVRVALGDVSKGAPALFRPPVPPTTENPLLPAQRQLGTVRPSQFAVLRQLFADARRSDSLRNTNAAVSKGRLKSGQKGVSRLLKDLDLKSDPKLIAMVPVLRKERPLRVVAHTAGDIQKALAFADEQQVHIVLEGATEAYKIGEEIAARRVPVVLETQVRLGKPMSHDFTRGSANGRSRVDTAAVLARSGVNVSLAPADDADLADTLLLAAHQVQYGVSRHNALKLVTTNPAVAMGLETRVGTIDAGRDADFAVLSGDPLDTTSHVVMTIVDGEVAYRRKVPVNAGNALAIKAGRILTSTRGEIKNGIIIVRGGKIESVSSSGIVPGGMRVIDASKSVVMPGIIDSYSHVGLHADAEPALLNPPSATTGSASGRTRLVNAIEPNDPAFHEALRGGVTAALLAPPVGGQVCGQAALLKMVTGKDQVVKELAALVFNVKGGAPRMAQAWNFRELIARGKDYIQRRGRYEQDRKNYERDLKEAEAKKSVPPPEPAEVSRDEDQEPFGPFLRKEIPAFIHANRSDEISTALTVFKAESDLNVVLVGVSDGTRIAETIQRQTAPVALGPSVIKREKGITVNSADVLSKAGIRVLFHSSATSGAALLRMNAAYAVRHGMDPVEALRALTIHPASALGVDGRIGSIEPGKDADLVILSGDPFDVTSRVERVLVNGKEAYRAK